MSETEERGSEQMDDIRNEELPGAPISESDAPHEPPRRDDAEAAEERLHSEDAFREDHRRAEADDTIDNPELAEVSEARDEAGDTPLIDVSYEANPHSPAEEVAVHVSPGDELDGVDGPGAVGSDADGHVADLDVADGLDPDVDELIADAAPVSEFEAETTSEGAGRDEDVMATDYDVANDEDVVEVPLASAENDGVATADSGAALAAAEPAEPAEPSAPAPEEPAPPAAADPYRGPGDWYVVHTYAGYENKVKTNLSSRIHTMQMEDKIFDVHIPMEDVMEIKGGKKQVVQKKVFPGYLLVKMIYDNDSWYVVRNTPGVTGFVAAGTGSKPTPLSRREVEKILSVKKEEVKPAFRLGFEERDVVRIISGPFADFNGTITEINVDQSKLKVLVNIFDRETPVELGFDQVAKV
jgi:transcription termination/antitermination protein NusG